MIGLIRRRPTGPAVTREPVKLPSMLDATRFGRTWRRIEAAREVYEGTGRPKLIPTQHVDHDDGF